MLVPDILGSPAAPQLIGGSVQASQVGLRWSDTTHLPNTQFLVQYRSNESSDWLYHHPDKPLSSTETTVKDLIPYVKYQVSFFIQKYKKFIVSLIGWVDFSKILLVNNLLYPIVCQKH